MRLLFAFIGILAATMSGQTPGPAVPPRAEAWNADLDVLAAVIETRHKNPFAHQSREAFRARVEAIRRDIPSSPDEAVMVRLAELAASVGDGHTNLQVYGRFARVPVRWFWFGDDLRIVSTSEEHRALLGLRVTDVGGTPVADVDRRLRTLIPAHESPSFLRSWSQQLLRMPGVLGALGIGGLGDALVVRGVTDDGREHQVRLRALSESADTALRMSRPYARPPLSASRPGDPFWFVRTEPAGLTYLHFAGYPERTRMRATAESLLAELDSGTVRTLLVDLRDNGGGDFKMGRLFIDLVRPAIERHRIRVFVAIGRATFSAGMTNATDFKRAFGAPYLGEVSGARPNGFQENDAFELPNSKLRGSVAKEHYAFQDADTAGLIPDVALPPTWSDLASGRDAVLEYVRASQTPGLRP